MAEEQKEEELELTLEETQDSSNDTQTNDKVNDNNSNNEDTSDEKLSFKKKKDDNKIKKILFGVIGFLVLTLIIGLILYLIGFFDPEEQKEEIPDKPIAQKQITQPKDEYKFSLKDVNTDNLNKELSKLTNKDILAKKEQDKIEEQKQILEKERQEYKEKLSQQEEELTKEKELLQAKKEKLEIQKNELEILKEQAKSLKEEMLREKEILEVEREKLILAQMEIENTIKHEENKKEQEMSKQTPSNELITASKEQMLTNTNESLVTEFVNLINVAKIKGELFKDYLDKILAIHNNVLLCRDDFNNIEIYFGPFTDNNQRNEIFNKLNTTDFSNAYEVELTREEFDKRCNY